MDLLFRELKNEATQTIVAKRNANIIYIRPHILRVGNPGGQLKVQIKDENGFLIQESNAVDISSIGSIATAHGYVMFNLPTTVRIDESYQLTVVAFNGYAYSTSDYVGLCRDFDLRKVDASYSPSTGLQSAFDFEIWERRMSDRVIEFFDGFESAAAPIEGAVTASKINSYVDDAAYEAAKGSVAEDGDLYRNSTSGLLRFHNGTGWDNSADQDVIETQASIDDSEAGPTDVVGMLLDQTVKRDKSFSYTMLRRNDSEERVQSGTIKIKYQPEAATCLISRVSEFGEDLGVTFTVTAAGQVQYSSDEMAGVGYNGLIIFKTITTFRPGV